MEAVDAKQPTKPDRHERWRTAMVVMQTIFSFLRLVLDYLRR